MRIALAQINTTVGDFDANRKKIVDFARRAAESAAQVVLFPELCLTGYPPRDLVEKPSFLARAEAEVLRIAAETADLPIHIIVGSVAPSHQTVGKKVLNSAVVLHRGQEKFRQTKMLLPTYDVFDEGRYFYSAQSQSLLLIEGVPVALTVCEDTWNQKQIFAERLYERDPISELKAQGAQLLLSINASPYEQGKRALRRELFETIAQEHGLPCVYVNSIGGNDHLVFDGSSFAMDARGQVIAEGPSFAESLIFCDVATGEGDRKATHADENEAVYEALVLGTRDYVTKCGFRKVLIGLSGGIDSSIVACV
ncbi:MAG: NAD+ synthase, partial [Acidobacteria bacterium]|nr:NAD+ synthase [Acidobacteriota bacterium]